MIVDMCMTRSVETVTPETTLTEAVHRMNARNIRRLVVVKNRAILGVVCKQDIVRSVGRLTLPHGVHFEIRAVRIVQGQRECAIHVQASNFSESMDEQTGQADALCSRFA